MAENQRQTQSRERQRGAALIMTVVVIMILTTLGMAMVAFTTTEERSASSYRDTLQTRSVAEGGVRLIQMMFSKPTDHGLVPVYDGSKTIADTASPKVYDYYGATTADVEASLNAIGIFRKDRSPLAPPYYTGAGNVFFAGPFGGRDGWGSAFGGTYSATAASDKYDLRYTCTNPSTNATIATGCWLDDKFNALLNSSTDWNLDSGKITDIRFYAAPATGGVQYGICTVRVTAEKRVNGELISRETVEAIIGDSNPRPAVLGNGNINFISQGGVMCGDGCEEVHANGNATVGNISGGEDPMVTATGTITIGTGTNKPGADAVVAPKINPWDLNYKPTSTSELANYYLVTARPLDTVWRDGDGTNNPASRPCGYDNMSRCQDYNLEYDTAGNAKPARTTAMTPYMYRWNAASNDWSTAGCTSGTTLNCGAGTPAFSVTTANDLAVTGTADTADIPFNKDRVPRTVFDITSKQDGATVLIDGMFNKHSSMDAIMTIIAVGSITFSSSSTWYPAMANRTMWISGRDINLQSNCCAPSNTCATNLANNAAQSIVATHEQIFSQSQTALAGIVIAESRVDLDNTTTGLAIDVQKGDHAYSCGLPDWPWELPTKPAIFSLKSSTN